MRKIDVHDDCSVTLDVARLERNYDRLLHTCVIGNYDFSKKMLKAASATQTCLTRRLKIHSLGALRRIKWLCSAKTTAQKNPTSFDP